MQTTLSRQTGRNASRMPSWIRQQLGSGAHFGLTQTAVTQQGLHTVCEEARCPNRGECWSRGTATFMLLGDICTRACGFCAVKTGKPATPDDDEPRRIVEAVDRLKLQYIVLTSVNRDDLDDGGAAIFAETIERLRSRRPSIGIELLSPDFYRCQGNAIEMITTALAAGDVRQLVWGHNVETVPRLYRQVRRGSDYARSLELLRRIVNLGEFEAKTALMLGLGETEEEVLTVMHDLRKRGVQRLALGQYLRPTHRHLPVQAYIHPEAFMKYEQQARDLGFTWVKAGPLVRSSYHAEEVQD